MSHIGIEIARQPGSWRRAAQLAVATESILPPAGVRLAVVGCGTSWFIAEAYARLREAAGRGETDAFAASEFPDDRSYDALVAITRSGTTTEVLDLLERTDGRLPRTVILADAASPAAVPANDVVPLGFADEKSVVQTVFATTVLALLRAHVGEDVVALADAADDALGRELQPEWTAAEQITFLGHGFGHGLAREAALKCREAAQLWTESYPSMEYRHGPISIAAPGRVVWQFGGDQAGLRAEVEATGAIFVDNNLDPMVDLVLAQRVAVAIAEARELDPDRPRNLTRSVILNRQSD